MATEILGVMLLLALAAAAVMYWMRVLEQEHARRVARRLDEIRHLTAVVRTYFAERRRTA